MQEVVNFFIGYPDGCALNLDPENGVLQFNGGIEATNTALDEFLDKLLSGPGHPHFLWYLRLILGANSEYDSFEVAKVLDGLQMKLDNTYFTIQSAEMQNPQKPKRHPYHGGPVPMSQDEVFGLLNYQRNSPQEFFYEVKEGNYVLQPGTPLREPLFRALRQLKKRLSLHEVVILSAQCLGMNCFNDYGSKEYEIDHLLLGKPSPAHKGCPYHLLQK